MSLIIYIDIIFPRHAISCIFVPMSTSGSIYAVLFMPYLLDPDKFTSSRPIRHTKNGVTKPKCDPDPETFGNLCKIS